MLSKNGAKLHHLERIITARTGDDDGIPWKDMGIYDAKAVTDRKLKSLLCDRGTVRNCRGCESPCAYGKELVRRADACK